MHKYVVFFLAFTLLFYSCKKDNTTTPNESELITTLTLTLKEVGGVDSARFVFRDLDGDGGNPPSILLDTLKASTAYSVEISLLDESKSPANDITDEVKNEGIDHQFFYTSSGIITSYNDTDNNGKPIGIKTRLQTLSAQSTSLTITLLHDPDKTASGVANGSITNAGGHADIEVTFNVLIE